jgi:hypothetical protein
MKITQKFIKSYKNKKFIKDFKKILVLFAVQEISEEDIVATMPEYFDIFRQFLYLIKKP